MTDKKWSDDKTIIKVTLVKIYIFHNDELLNADVKDVETLKENYFNPKALNKTHAYRDKNHLGYGDRITKVELITEEEMVKFVKSD